MVLGARQWVQRGVLGAIVLCVVLQLYYMITSQRSAEEGPFFSKFSKAVFPNDFSEITRGDATQRLSQRSQRRPKHSLDDIPIEALSWEGHQLKIGVLLKPQCAAPTNLEVEAGCVQRMLETCPLLSEQPCFQEALSTLPEACSGLVEPGAGESQRDWWMGAFRRAVPHLRSMGWNHLRLIAWTEDDAAVAAAADVDILVTGYLNRLHSIVARFPTKHFIVVDKSDPATLTLPHFPASGMQPSDWIASRRVLAVLKAAVLLPQSRQNGPLVQERAHLSLVPSLPSVWNHSSTAYRPRFLTPPAIEKIHALLPLAMRWRYPLGCGGDLAAVRFHAFFAGNGSGWTIRPFAERPLDVAYMGRQQFHSSPALNAHRRTATDAVTSLQHSYPNLKIGVPHKVAYNLYLKFLLELKILVSPWGWGEWSHKDFEAMMCGCLVVKPGPDTYRLYPHLHEPDVTVVAVRPDFSDLEQKLLPLLQNPAAAQAMVDEAAWRLRESSRPKTFAQALNNLLLNTLRGGLA